MKTRNRSRKAVINGATGLMYEFVTIVCGLILPRLILSAFGSSYNGITQSITQFLSFVTLLRAGVGAVTKAALYKPLASGDKVAISRIIRATEIFMQRIAMIFIAGLVILAATYPLLVENEFEWLFAASLVIIIGFSTFVQYYFGITYQMLLEADQCQYIVSVVSTLTTIANIIIASCLIKSGSGIHAVKLGSSIVFALNPVAINLIVRKKYKIDRSVSPDNTAIKQRWDAFAQQVAMLVRDNTAIIILTAVTNTLEVSVYTTYFMVIKAINSMLRAFTNGISAAFGNMLAKKETEALLHNLRLYELMVYTLSIILYSTTFLLITPFVMVYTDGIIDANYNRPIFGYIMSIAYLFFCIRIPYQNIVEVAGHFKQTKKGAYVEAILNLSVSIIFSVKYGIVGVAIGILVAMAFRTFQYAFYVSNNIIIRSHKEFLKRLLLSGVTFAIIIIVEKMIPDIKGNNYFVWALNAVVVFCISCGITLLEDVIFYNKEMKQFIEKLLGVIKR